MNLALLPDELAVCQVADLTEVRLDAPFCFLAKTDEEVSLVCRREDIPGNAVAVEDGWRAFRIQGKLDFSLVGVLAGLAALLAEAGVSIFAVSTYNTDYILVRSGQLAAARCALAAAGHRVV